jgi:catalase
VRANPASFDDHFSQATMFFRSMSAIEQAHIVEAYTFELSKCYEQPIRERQLQALANIDADLCEQVAAGLGLPAPKGEPAKDVTLSPALSQVVTEPGPIAGRKIGVIADAGSDLAGIAKLRRAAEKLGATVLVIAPVGGVLGEGANAQVVERTRATARSIEFDTIVIAAGTAPSNDIKQVILLQEAYHHSKALGAWGDGAAGLEAAGIPAGGPGVLVGSTVGKPFIDELVAALGLHRVWDRAPAVMASAVPPAV